MRPPLLMLLCLPFALAACGDDPTAVCKSNLNWRSPSVGTIACKGASGCVCDAQSVCCVQVVAGNPPTVSDGVCTALTACPGLAFRCDGPEDCSAGTVCCAELDNAGGGSSCMEEKDCRGVGTTVLCRTNDDCSKVKDCKPSAPGTFFEGVVGYCD